MSSEGDKVTEGFLCCFLLTCLDKPKIKDLIFFIKFFIFYILSKKSLLYD
jgi:hypothetical protein